MKPTADDHDHPELQSQIDDMMKAFPAEDVDGHRRYHDIIIEQIEGKKRLRQAIIEKTIPAMLWAALIWVGIACWNSLKGALAFVVTR